MWSQSSWAMTKKIAQDMHVIRQCYVSQDAEMLLSVHAAQRRAEQRLAAAGSS